MNELSLIKKLFTKGTFHVIDNYLSLDIQMRTRIMTFNSLMLLTFVLPLLWFSISIVDDPHMISKVIILLWLAGFLAYILSIVSQNNVSRSLFAYAIHAFLGLPFPITFMTFGITSIVIMFETIYLAILIILVISGVFFIVIVTTNRLRLLRNSIEDVRDNKPLNVPLGQWDSKHDQLIVSNRRPNCLLFALLMVGVLLGASILKTMVGEMQLNVIRVVFGAIGYGLTLWILQNGFTWIILFIEWEKKLGIPIYLV